MHTSGLNVIKVTENIDPAAPVHFIGIRVALDELGIDTAGDYHPLPVETLVLTLLVTTIVFLWRLCSP